MPPVTVYKCDVCGATEGMSPYPAILREDRCCDAAGDMDDVVETVWLCSRHACAVLTYLGRDFATTRKALEYVGKMKARWADRDVTEV